MIIPIFIAILLGLVNPTMRHSQCKGGTVTVNSTTPGDPGNEPGTGDPGSGGSGEGGSGEDGTGGPSGDNGQTPPPKP
ncbi:hypothetical protein [Pedobacter sp. ASV12]|uniref:hypothetical protein n=1 Tax=Pedobacter sp. ASV12 TaxID=2795120 RepID=UPI0018EDA069|nr:hypothetical protein [Pedobacter sp. ASV12]